MSVDVAARDAPNTEAALCASFVDRSPIAAKAEFRQIKLIDKDITMKAEDVTETLELALKASGCESAKVADRVSRRRRGWKPRSSCCGIS